MIFKERYTFQRIDQDLAPDKRTTSTHLNIENMEIFLTSRGASLQVAKGMKPFDIGSEFLLDSHVIGHGTIATDSYIFITDNKNAPNTTSSDAILKVILKSNIIELQVVKQGNWSFSTLNPIDSIGIVESPNSEKLYWIDGYNQARYINVKSYTIATDSIDFVLTNPTPAVITAIPYGIAAVKDAVVRYGYTQYDVAGSESKLSPLTNPVNISTQGDSARITVSGLSTIYDNYRIYRVMWETYKGEPTYTMIAEGVVPPDASAVTVVDSGNLSVTEISIDEFVDIGSDLLIPGTLVAKKNRLFFGNYEVEPYNIDADFRAYGFNDSANVLDTPEDIPDEFIPFTVVKDGKYVTGELVNSLETPNIESEMTIGVEHFFFNTTGDTIYLETPRTANFPSMYLNIYDSLDITHSTPLNDTPLYVRSTVGDYHPPLLKVSLSPPSGDYIVEMWSVEDLSTPTIVTVNWSESVVQSLVFDVYHDQIPDIDGWSYTGVTAVLTGTQVKVGTESSVISNNFSPFYDVTTAIVDGGGLFTTLTFLIDPYATINGIAIPEGVPLLLVLNAKLDGTRQEILGGVIELQSSGYTPGVTPPDVFTGYNAVPKDHDAINPDWDTYKYQANGTSLGMEGPIVKLALSEVQQTETNAKNRVFKQGEIYRIGIVGYDEYGRSSSAYWVCDLKIPYANGGDVNTGYRKSYKLQGMLKSSIEGLSSFKFVYVERTPEHRTILCQGVVNPVMDYSVGGINIGLYPFPNMKEIKGNGASNTSTDFGHFDVRTGNNPNVNEDFPTASWSTYSTTAIHDRRVNMVYTPETFLHKTDIPANKIKLIGIQQMDTTADRTRMEYYNAEGNSDQKVTLHEITFDMNAELGESEAPSMMFDSWDVAPEDEHQPYGIYMFHRSGGIFRECTHKEENLLYSKYLGIDSITTIDSYVVSNVINQDAFAGKINEHKCNYQAEFPDAYIITAENADWAGTNQYQDFLDGVVDFGSSILNRAFPMVELLQNVAAQYGGDSWEARSLNTYIDCSEAVTTPQTWVTLFGDTYNGTYYFPRATSARSTAEVYDVSTFDYVKIAVESTVSVDTANKLLRDINGSMDGAVTANLKSLEVKNLLTYDTIFSQVPDALITLTVPFNYVKVTDYETRITVSNSKHAGEVVDNWTKVNLGTYMDLESPYGSITKLVRVSDRVYAFQDKAIVYISIFPEKQIQTATGGLQLAKGSVLDNFIYITADSGTQNKQAIAVYGDDIFFIDTVNKTLNTLSEGEVSPIKGFNSVANAVMNDSVAEYLINNPNGGFVVVNNSLKQVLFKFSSQFPMLAYNYVTKQFTNTRTYDSTYFFRHDKYVLSSQDSVLYIHGEGERGMYGGVSKPARIHMYVEPVPGMDKIFDAVELLKAGAVFDMVTVTSPTRTSGRVPITFSSKYDLHNAFLPRVENSMDKFRERNVEIILEYTGSEELEVDEIFVKFSIKK